MDISKYQTVSNLVEQPLGKKEKAVYDYILKNPGMTVNKICTDLDGKVSPLTVRRKIKKMLKDGVIEDRKTGNSFHDLHVSDKTEFSRITKELQKLDTCIMLMSEPLQKLNRLEQQFPAAVGGYMQKLVFPYFQSMFTMFWKLLDLSTGETQIAKPDSLKLHSQIIGLIAKTTHQPFHELDHKSILATQKSLLNRIRQELSAPGSDKSIVNVALIDNLLRIIEKFEEKFLN